MRSHSSNPSFAEGALLAFVLSVLGSVAYISLSLFFISSLVGVFVLTIIGGAYLFYLIKRSRGKGGKLVASLAVSIVLLVCTLLPLSLTAVLCVFVIGIWLLRSLYFRHGFLDSVFDLALNFFSLAAAVAALIVSESHFLAFWTFFITQALNVYLPAFSAKQTKHGEQASDRFRRAYVGAESALSRMHKPAR